MKAKIHAKNSLPFTLAVSLLLLAGGQIEGQTQPLNQLTNLRNRPASQRGKRSPQEPVTSSTLKFHMRNYTTGLSPYDIAAGDFNHDGTLDVVTANSGSNSVSVLLNNGAGIFGGKTDFTVGNGPDFVTAGDFNGDGKLDLAVWNSDDGTFSILLGNGNGTFQSQIVTDLGTPVQADTLGTGDFNGDGKLDLAVTDFINAGVRVLLGNGDRTFQTAVSYPVAARALKLAVADLRNIGVLDLIVPTWLGGQHDSVSVLLGNGDGTFQPAKNYSVDAEPGSVVAADFNGDGVLDLSVANICGHNPVLCESVGTVSVLLGNGDGTFKPQNDYSVGEGPFDIGTADYDGNGTADLVVPNAYDSDVTILFGKGDGTFFTQQTYRAGRQASSLVTGNFAGGGLDSADIILANWDGYEGTSITTMLNEAGTHTSLSSSPNPSKSGQTVTFTATVRSSVRNIGTPTGTVMFFSVVNGKQQTLGTGTLANGTATFQYSQLPSGRNRITAMYSGDSNFNSNYDERGLVQTVQ